MSEKLDEVLLAEKEAKKRIDLILKEKEDMLRLAKEKAKKELRSHEDDLRKITNDKITDLLSNKNTLIEVEEKTKKDLKLIDELALKNQQEVVNYLFKTVTYVDIVIPDVVKENFEENYKI